jgi:hypothetical protein
MPRNDAERSAQRNALRTQRSERFERLQDYQRQSEMVMLSVLRRLLARGSPGIVDVRCSEARPANPVRRLLRRRRIEVKRGWKLGEYTYQRHGEQRTGAVYLLDSGDFCVGEVAETLHEWVGRRAHAILSGVPGVAEETEQILLAILGGTGATARRAAEHEQRLRRRHQVVEQDARYWGEHLRLGAHHAHQRSAPWSAALRAIGPVIAVLY